MNSAEQLKSGVALGSWNHIAFVRNKATNTIIVYLNGVPSAPAADTTGNINFAGSLSIGGRPGTIEVL